MSLIPARYECPVCFNYDSWVGEMLPKHRCTCPPASGEANEAEQLVEVEHLEPRNGRSRCAA